MSKGLRFTFDSIYPPREGYGTVQNKKEDKILHIGYVSGRTKPCSCGTVPVLEQYVHDAYPDPDSPRKTIRNVPAQKFVCICPVCELRAAGEGDIEFVEQQWNKGIFSKDGMMVRERLKNPSPEAVYAISGAIVAGCIEEAIDLIHKRHEQKKLLDDMRISDAEREIRCNDYRSILSNLRSLEAFFRESPLMMDHDPEAVLSEIRKAIYPGNTMEDVERRLKIPLRLVSM